MNMLPIFIFTIVHFVLTICSAHDTTSENSGEPADSLSSMKVLGEVEGDLNKDGVPEKVVIYDTDSETEFGTEREIHIFKKENDAWSLWKTSIGAVLPSAHGGMMGDPFQEVSIVRNCIVIYHFGGSRWKWNYTHRYRFQNNDWQLIGATINYGTPCDYSFTFDYNLSTGNIIYEKDTEFCNDTTDQVENVEKEKEVLTRKLKELPSMDNFRPGHNEVALPNGERVYY